jgi:hypothetical protein
VPTKFVDKFAKKIDRSTDKFGFLGHSNKTTRVVLSLYHIVLTHTSNEGNKSIVVLTIELQIHTYPRTSER